VDTDVAAHLQSVLATSGPDLAADPQAVGERLGELAPDRQFEIQLLVAAAEEGASLALLDRSGPPPAEQVATLSQDLAQARGLSSAEADWAVRAWAFALGTGVPSPGPLTRSGRAGSRLGRTRARMLVAGATVLVVAVAVAVLISQLGNGSDDDTTPTVAGTSAAPSPNPAAAGLVVLAHQGGWETFPLETLPAFKAAAESGATVETDVHWTADGVPVLVHDDRTTSASEAGKEHPMVCAGGPYTVSKTTWSVLRAKCRTQPSASKDGRSYPIPTFDEALKAIAAVPEAQVVAEVKPARPTADQVRAYLATITKYDLAERTVVSSFSPEALAAVKAQAAKDHPALRYLLMLRPSEGGALPTPDELSAQGLWGVALRSDIATRGNVAGVKAKNLVAVVWTVNTTDQWSAAKQAGVDLVLTDKPDAYRDWLP
jgi:glycerophosphoryl diester phosphodiesterase